MKSLVATSLLVDNYDDAIKWFREKLNFVILVDEPVSETNRFIKIAPHPQSDFSLVLQLVSNDKLPFAMGVQSVNQVAFFLQTDCFDEDYANMIASGVIFKEKPRLEPYGKVVVFTDLWGNLWDLIEPKTRSLDK